MFRRSYCEGGTTTEPAVCSTAVELYFGGRNVLLTQMPGNICADSATNRHMVGLEVGGEQD